MSNEFDPFAGPAFEKSAPSTESQREVFAATQWGPEASCAYNESVSLSFDGALDSKALQSALAALVGRHESLRSFFTQDGQTLFVRPKDDDSNAVPALQLIDLSTLSTQAREERLAALVAEETETPFDLENGPLLRAKLFKLGDDRHQLALTAHHIVVDGWSWGVLLRELGALYTAERTGAAVDLDPAPSFVQYALNERTAESTQSHAQALSYWLKQFASIPPELDLPVERSRPVLKTYASRRVDFPLPKDLTDRLKKAGAKVGASYFVVLMAGFAAMLHRLTGQDDIVIGIPSAGQSASGEHGLVGHVVNNLPLRFSFSAGMSFVELAKAARTVVLDGLEHQQLTYGALLNQLVLKRDPSRLPLVNVAFNLEQGAQGNEFGFVGLDTRSFSNPRSFENFELFFNAVETQGVTLIEVQYNTDLFDQGTVQRWLVSLQTLIESIVAAPNTRLDDLNMLAVEERERIAGWNQTEVPFERATTLHEQVEAQVDRAPQALAVVCEGAQLTYGELDQRANQLAHHLRSLGVGPEVRVGICVRRSLDMVVAILGVLKAGGAYVPLDPSYPPERLTFMLDDSNAPVVVTQDEQAHLVKHSHVAVVSLDSDRAALDACPVTRPSPVAKPESLAYVIYTSGTTGQPKGVMIEHRMAVNLVAGLVAVEEIRPGDRVLQFTSFSFDPSVQELFTALTSGATSVVRGEAVPSMEDLLSGPAYAGLTVMNLITAYWHALTPDALPTSLRLVAFGGERASPEHVRRWSALSSKVKLLNLYGPTEGTIAATGAFLDAEKLVPGRAVTIGGPLANYQVHVLDPQMRPVPIDVPGELYIGGEGVARGYLNRPELTAEKFIPNPYGLGRLYRTGDKARWQADGTIEYLGRMDQQQVKIRGFRVELGEIEAAVATYPTVREVVVLAREDAPGDKRLSAYVVLKTGEGDDGLDIALRHHLRASLPEHMVPQYFIVLKKLPLTPNGKVDTKVLPAPHRTDVETAGYVEPATDDEKSVAVVWQQVLGLASISKTANFFELGGHSLLAVQAITRLSQAKGVQLPMRQMFLTPTVESMATALAEAKNRGAAKRQLIPRVASDAVKPLSLMQQRLWMMEELVPGTALYNIPHAFRFRGALDWSALERALNEIIRRHDVLRTTLHWHEDGPEQRVQDELRIELAPLDFSTKAPAMAEAEMMALFHAAAHEVFDLRKGPLIKFCGIRMPGNEHVLFFVVHHAVWDGWSIDVFLRELDAIYTAFVHGKEHGVAALPIRYSDFAAWHLQQMQGPELQRQLGYWRQKLGGGLEPLELPSDKPRPLQFSYEGAIEPFELNVDEVEALTALGRAHGATLYMVMLAAFKVMLHCYTKQTDILVGTPVHGRGQPEVENLIGFFVNTLVLRTGLDNDPEFPELLARVRTTVLEALDNQDAPFEQLVADLDVERDMSRTPIFQAFFAFLDTDHPHTLGGIPYEPLAVQSNAATTDISLWLISTSGKGLTGELNYSTDLFTASTMRRFLLQYRELLSKLVHKPAVRLSRLNIISEDEIKTIERWNATSAPFDRAALIHELFEAQVDKSPDAVALVFDGRNMSYSELDARANQIAHALRAAGVGSGTLVGLCVERSHEMVAAFLGILKAGGAYVPLDPAYPKDRLGYMIEDSRMPVLLTTDALNDTLDAHAAKVVTLSSTQAGPAARLGQKTTEAENPAYVIYTSGSTGKPKGVVVPHRSVSNFISTMQKQPGLTNQDTLVAVTTLSFDIAVLELHVALCSGARVVVASREEVQDGRRLAALLESATIMQATPSTWRILIDAGWKGRPEPQGALPAFKALVGGEALPQALAAQLLERTGELWNMYGPTETTVWSTCQRVENPQSIRIGRPIANTTIEVLDAHLSRQPIGVVGELFIGGDGVTLGYLHRPDLTAERFIADPFRPGQKLYKTGDLARWMSDGTVDYIGRNDHQVKVRGFRIELGEIEAVLAGHAALASNVVLVREDVPGDVRIVAYVVPREGADYTDTELRKHLRKSLPDYMIPQHFVELNKLPLTPNGKVDRKALPAPAGSSFSARALVSPRTDAERMLAQLFEESLKVSDVSVHDNFFDLGGHSLLCFQVIAKVQEKTGVRLNPRIMLMNTLEQTAALLAQEQDNSLSSSSTEEGASASAAKANADSFAQKMLRKLGLH